jgi:hypothetical protein
MKSLQYIFIIMILSGNVMMGRDMDKNLDSLYHYINVYTVFRLHNFFVNIKY